MTIQDTNILQDRITSRSLTAHTYSNLGHSICPYFSFMTDIYDSAKRKHPAIEELIALWKYRDLIYQLVRRDIVARYKRSFLGVAWTMLNPLGTMLIMVIVFSQVFDRADNYAAYVLTGVICWTMFSQSTTMAMSSMVWGSALFKQIYVPRTAFVVSTIMASMVNFVISLVPLLLFT